MENQQTPQSFIERLDLALTYRGWKMADLNRLLGVAHSTMSRWRSGAVPHFSTLNAVADALEVRRKWLRQGEGGMELSEQERALLTSRRAGGGSVEKTAAEFRADQETDLLHQEIMLRLNQALKGVNDEAATSLKERLDLFLDRVKTPPPS